MKKLNLTKLSRTELKEVFGGYTLHPILCKGGCHGEAMIRCPDGSTTMTDYICMGDRCEVNTAYCRDKVLEPIEGPLLPLPSLP
ncbi:MAG: TIGR04149 family rSAM-modified RiPP [Chryseobacterium sp.]|jgi:natural product precursor|nr:TIGR04149 family rSAM-modified RiPP [Chryseobacterium sp.]